MSRVAVIGGSGFVGRAVLRAVAGMGSDATPVRAPRLDSDGDHDAVAGALADSLAGYDAVINAAGVPGATSADGSALVPANAVLPRVILRATRAAGVPRLVHVSSAAVQGRREPLDSSWAYDGFSAYSRSKIDGEVALRDGGGDDWTIYRPGGVHGPDRSVTRAIARLARSPFLVMPRSAHPTPLALIDNVGSAVATLALSPRSLPRVVHHPWEGMTTHSVIEVLGGRDPRTVPDPPARLLTAAARLAPGALAGQARRLDLLWFGQRQASSWLTENGWTPPAGHDAWVALGRSLSSPTTEGHDVEPR